MTANALVAENLTLHYGDAPVIEDLTTAIPQGRITVILGPNACGKSTLLRGLAGLLTPATGRVMLEGEEMRRLKPKALARRVGFLPQAATAPHGVTVGELVARGRYPHQMLLQQWSARDAEAVNAAMEATAVAELASRSLDELSGGQRQRAWIAMLLAQETPVMLLDEPTTYLDIAHQLEVLNLCRVLNQRHQRTVVLVLHDVGQACRYADHLIVMREGKVVSTGAPTEVITEDLIADTFGLRSLIRQDPVTNTPMVLPIEPLAAESRDQPQFGGETPYSSASTAPGSQRAGA